MLAAAGRASGFRRRGGVSVRRLADRPLDVFVDLTAVTGELDSEPLWPNPDRFTARAGRVTCAIRPNTWSGIQTIAGSLGWTLVSSRSAIVSCTDAMARAAADDASLLVLHGPVEISAEALFVMRQCLERDPMFGCVAARLGCADGCCARRPSQSGLAAGPWIPRRILAETSEIEIAPELFESSLLFRPEIVGEFGALDTRFSGLPASLLHYLSLARRCGYRTVLANRAMVTVPGVSCTHTENNGSPISKSDQALLRRAIPDLTRGWNQYRAASNERFERLSGHAHRAAAGAETRSLLLDVRNVGNLHNGTSHAILGCLRALRHLSPPWNISVLAQADAVRFHRIGELTSGWTVVTTVPTSPFTAALRLSQPWHIQEMVDLHQAALFNAYFMLDTIAWDILLLSAQRLDGTWGFLAECADGFLFDSGFTERRFLSRFTRATGTPRAVCRYPFARDEYVDTDTVETEAFPYVLIVGNDHDHKDVERTIDLLTTAFPFQRIVSLGPHIAETAYLRVHRSGSLPERAVHRLYAGARCVIFPSFYEGFGFPVVTALAYGKTLIARRSELLDEIAAHCTNGRLIAFTHRDELVNILGRLIHGETVPEEPLGAALSAGAERPRRWEDVAREMIEFLDQLVRQPSRARWLERERLVNQLLAFQI
jgi:glycosyltransferase involved in cell wall biosynthesis